MYICCVHGASETKLTRSVRESVNNEHIDVSCSSLNLINGATLKMYPSYILLRWLLFELSIKSITVASFKHDFH